MLFEWNIAKAKNNLRKHGVSFEEAASVFLDPLALTFADPDHSADEEREITIGLSLRQKAVLVSHCWRGERTRIISARKATRNEKAQYEEGIR
ncbi:MAG TPA: BrnT family toxin [Candidatus Bathyarchaeia archaeon]|nr:BrnT family toxin [Candidatus Bathyarchaeia archaeon]